MAKQTKSVRLEDEIIAFLQKEVTGKAGSTFSDVLSKYVLMGITISDLSEDKWKILMEVPEPDRSELVHADAMKSAFGELGQD